MKHSKAIFQYGLIKIEWWACGVIYVEMAL